MVSDKVSLAIANYYHLSPIVRLHALTTRQEETMITGARVAILLVGMLAAAATWSQQYPVKPIRLVLPFPPGGGTDTVGRIVALKLSEQLGQQVIVENRPGGGANIGAELVAKSAPDGYTLLVPTITNAIGQTLYTRLGFDLVKDFQHISLL